MHGILQDMRRTLFMIPSEQWIEIYDDDVPLYRYKDEPNLLYRGKVAYIRNTPEKWMKERIYRNDVYAIGSKFDRYHQSVMVLVTKQPKKIFEPCTS